MKQLHLLLLEDSESDAELIKLVLKRSGIDHVVTLAITKEQYLAALDEREYDVILADNSLPQFSGSEALEIVNARYPGLPFILVTGSISEEYAVKMIKDGASDYILKDRLQRLPSALQSALDTYKLRGERDKHLEKIITSEALLNEAAMLAHFGSWETDLLHQTERWSDEQFRILGYEPGEVEPSADRFIDRIYPDDRQLVKEMMGDVAKSGERKKCNCRIVARGGDIKHIITEMAATIGSDGSVQKINGFIMDVTEAREAELKEKMMKADLLQRNKDLEQFAYIISHNLRGPVANIAGLSDVLIDNNVHESEKTGFMEALSTCVKKLDGVILDLNDIIQVKNHINENKQKTNLPQLVEEIKMELSKAMKESNAIINCNLDETKEMLTLKSYLHSIFYNLIANSIKFRKKGVFPVIDIQGKIKEDKTVLTFKDNGVGIDMEKRSHHVFGLYKRFHPEHAEGKGMGLFMVKTQVEALGGRIGVESMVNEGTTFTIEFDRNFTTVV